LDIEALRAAKLSAWRTFSQEMRNINKLFIYDNIFGVVMIRALLGRHPGFDIVYGKSKVLPNNFAFGGESLAKGQLEGKSKPG
jgi:hypothetical protein